MKDGSSTQPCVALHCDQAKDSSWFEVRLDAQIPGTVLLRDTDNLIYFITLNIQQVCLVLWRCVSLGVRCV